MFIGRNTDGSIYGAWTSPPPDDADHPRVEEVADDHPDVVAFASRQSSLPPSDVKQLADMLAEKKVITAEQAATFDQDAKA